MDMTQTIQPRSDQLNADSLLAGPRTITITEVSGNPDSAEQPVSVHYSGEEGRPFKPCKSMRRVMVHAWGPDAKAYVGRSMTLYCDPKVKWGGMAVGGIRISHMSDIESTMTMALTETKGKRAPFVVKPLAAQRASEPTLTWQDHADRLRVELERVSGDEARNAINNALTQPWWKAMKGENADLAATLRKMAELRIKGEDISSPEDAPTG